MFSLITYGLGAALLSAFLYVDGPNIVKNNLVVKYKKFRKINNMVATNYKGIFTILWISLCLVGKALWISMLQRINNSVVQLSKNKYQITYVVNGKIYKMIVTPTRGPRKVLLAHDENEEDISYLIFPYLGPEEDFHGKTFSPDFFDRKKLYFECSDGGEHVFDSNETIKL